jgi:two-component system CheB/CheR fusion protein
LNDAADVSPERLRRFFTKEGDDYRVRREVREMILFAHHNLIKDPPFSHLDLVSCRNLLIYLTHTAQERVMETIHFALKPGGYLFIGSSESVEGSSDLFTPVDKENHIFQSRQVASRPFPVPESVPVYRAIAPPKPDPRTNVRDGFERITYNELHLKLVEEFAPPSVVVDQNYDLVHVSERAGRYLLMSGGEPSNNLLKLIRPDIRLELRTALFQATQQKGNVEFKNLDVKLNGHSEKINLLIRPVTSETDMARGFILVVFEPVEDGDAGIHETDYAPPEPVAKQLEEELLRSRTQLQSALEQSEVQAEELRASNEELQAMNEELRSSAEELETSKEELQSINEELTTVNQELKVKIEELSHTNNNFQNLLSSIDIGVIFLDRGLRVNLFSPAARRIFNLLPNDMGRPLSDITSHIIYDDLASDADNVLASLQTVEREVRSGDGRVFLMRLFPYRTAEDRLKGVVVTFVEITERAFAESALKDTQEKYPTLFERIDEGFCVIEVIFDQNEEPVDYRFVETSPSFARHTGLNDVVGKRMREIGLQHEDLWFERYGRIAKTGQAERFEGFAGRLGGRWYDVYAFRVGHPNDRLVGVLFNEISRQKETESALRASEERLRLLMESLTDIALFTTDTASIVTSWNPGSEKIFGFTADEMVGKRSADIIFTPEDRDKGAPEKERRGALKSGKALDERWHLRKNGDRFYASGFMVPLYDGGADRRLVGFGKIAQDLTSRAQVEQVVQERERLRRLIDAQEEERQRIARDLHDHLGQQLTALRLKIEGLKANYKAEPAMMKAIDETQEQAKNIDDEVSFMTWELMPTALNNLGLRKALAAFVREWSRNYGIEAEFHTARAQRKRLASDIEVNLYRIAQEALNNIVKHAKASKADVMLEIGKQDVVLIVEDNGQGLDTKAARRRTKKGKLGLVGMQERAALLGGTLEIESERLRGTTIIARVPIRFAEQKPSRSGGKAKTRD